MKLHLKIPLPPNRANPKGQGHWAVSHKAGKAYIEGVRHLITRQVTAQGVTGPLRRAHATVRLRVWNIYDDDNATALLKWPIDALRAAQLLIDDRRPHFQLDSVEQELNRTRPAGWPHQHIQITLEGE